MEFMLDMGIQATWELIIAQGQEANDNLRMSFDLL